MELTIVAIIVATSAGLLLRRACRPTARGAGRPSRGCAGCAGCGAGALRCDDDERRADRC